MGAHGGAGVRGVEAGVYAGIGWHGLLHDVRAGGARIGAAYARAMANVRPPLAARLRKERAAQAADTGNGAVEPPE